MAVTTHSIRHGEQAESALFTKSDVLSGARAQHSPYLVLETRSDGAHVTQVRDLPDLLAFPDDTQVLWLWPGRDRSDYFVFTVGDFRANRALVQPSGYVPSDEAIRD